MPSTQHNLLREQPVSQ